MKHAIAAVIGHVDHGKTTLVRALTGTDTDRLPEEKRRGISIALGFAFLPDGAGDGDGGGIDLVDVPGHERFVRTAVAGAGGLDFVLLVVAATEGVREQTREHLAIAALLGVERCVLAVTKTDLVDADTAELALLDAREAAEGAGLRCAAAVGTGADGRGIAALRDALLGCRNELPERLDDGAPFLPVDRVFSIAGHGTVVTGTLRGGALATGDTVAVLPGNIQARVRELQERGVRVARAEPGGRLAVNLRGVNREAVPGGAMLALPDAMGASAWLGVWLQAAGRELSTGMRLQLLIGTAEREVRLRLLDREVLADGEEGPAQLRLGEPIAVPARMRFVLRLASPADTVGGGTVIEPEGGRARRHDPAVVERFRLRATGSRAAILGDAVRRAGRSGIAVAALARLAGTGAAQAVAALDPGAAILVRNGVAVAPDALGAVETGVRLLLRRTPDGVARDAIARMLPSAGAAVLDEALGRLAERGEVRRRDALYSIPDAARDQANASRDARELAALAEML
ncbi:MAG: selenocysteine-specific translation elongation factor, partial [Gluconacetobacter diazotrophicus]|nr:selenocysteine-specific translation elongation factor [Gluconacetobacter diazotrophicus]